MIRAPTHRCYMSSQGQRTAAGQSVAATVDQIAGSALMVISRRVERRPQMVRSRLTGSVVTTASRWTGVFAQLGGLLGAGGGGTRPGPWAVHCATCHAALVVAPSGCQRSHRRSVPAGGDLTRSGQRRPHQWEHAAGGDLPLTDAFSSHVQVERFGIRVRLQRQTAKPAFAG